MNRENFDTQRLYSLVNRSRGYIEKCDQHNNNSFFKIKQKYNVNHKSLGVVSTCLFGNLESEEIQKRYLKPLLQNANQISNILPGWVLRIYLSPTISEKIIQLLIDNNCEVYVMTKKPDGYIGTMWRFLPAAENKPFISYDADMLLEENSLFVPVLASNINKWLATNKPFFRRRLAHVNILIPISAGMWGAKPINHSTAAIPDIQEIMEQYCDTEFGCDESFLAKEVWPKFNNKGYYSVSNKLEWIILVVIFLLILILLTIIILREANRVYHALH
jgi:hypothetical protein